MPILDEAVHAGKAPTVLHWHWRRTHWVSQLIRALLPYTRRMVASQLEYHGQPHGIWSADECFGGRDLNRGIELCAVVEQMYSLQHMFRVQADLSFLDRCERIAYNALPAELTSAGSVEALLAATTVALDEAKVDLCAKVNEFERADAALKIVLALKHELMISAGTTVLCGSNGKNARGIAFDVQTRLLWR